MIINIRDVHVERKDSTSRRARKEMGDISRLANSIKKHGLLHPIIVDDMGDGGWRLIAGERRLRACMLNGDSQIEAKLVKDIDDITAKEIEIEENVVRQNLAWPEECDAVRQLDELKKKMYGKAQPGHREGGWKIADTAETVGMSAAAVAQDIKLAKDLKAHPEMLSKVSRLPKTAARKIVRMMLEAEMLKRQVDSHQLTISANLLLGDACQLIDTLDDESIHLLLTDPPFAKPDIVNVGSSGTMTYNITETNVSSEEKMREVYKVLWPKVFKKLVPGAHIYVFLGMGWYTELYHMLILAGFDVDEVPLIWSKQRPTAMAKDMHYMSSYEAVLFGHKPPINRILRKPVNNVIPIPALPPQQRAHPLQKPFELLKLFIENSSNVGEVVLDCFAGSAMTLIAAEKLQRSSIGFELDEGNYLRAQAFMKKELNH